MDRIEVEFSTVFWSFFFAFINFLSWWIRLIRNSYIIIVPSGRRWISLSVFWQNLIRWALALSFGSNTPSWIWINDTTLAWKIRSNTFIGTSLQLLFNNILNMWLGLLRDLLVILRLKWVMIHVRNNLTLIYFRNTRLVNLYGRVKTTQRTVSFLWICSHLLQSLLKRLFDMRLIFIWTWLNFTWNSHTLRFVFAAKLSCLSWKSLLY
jgi:hypothetical protein